MATSFSKISSFPFTSSGSDDTDRAFGVKYRGQGASACTATIDATRLRFTETITGVAAVNHDFPWASYTTALGGLVQLRADVQSKKNSIGEYPFLLTIRAAFGDEDLSTLSFLTTWKRKGVDTPTASPVDLLDATNALYGVDALWDTSVIAKRYGCAGREYMMQDQNNFRCLTFEEKISEGQLQNCFIDPTYQPPMNGQGGNGKSLPPPTCARLTSLNALGIHNAKRSEFVIAPASQTGVGTKESFDGILGTTAVLAASLTEVQIGAIYGDQQRIVYSYGAIDGSAITSSKTSFSSEIGVFNGAV